MARAARRRNDAPERLLVLSPVYPPAVGGIERLAEDIVHRWPGEVLVVSLEEPGSAEHDNHLPHAVVRASNVPRGGRRSIARLTLLGIRAARTYRPDVILSMHVRCAPATVVMRMLTGARWVQYYHATEIPTWPHSTRLAARADAGIAVSRYTASLVAEASGASVTVIPPGVDPGPHSATAAGKPGGTPPTILTIARINDAYKGHDVMLEALPEIVEQVPGVRWVVVGDGSLLDQLRANITSRGLEGHVELCGRVSEERRLELLRTATVFALPSRTGSGGREGEGFGIVFVEAAAHGLPSVAAELGGSADAVSDGISGFLVDATDPRAVARSIIDLLQDDDLRGRLSDGSTEWARKFAWDAVYPRIAAVLSGSADAG